jgi:hypothetical protein
MDKADQVAFDVRFGSLADIAISPTHVRFTPKSRHRSARCQCPFCAISGFSGAAKNQVCSQSAARQTTEGPVLTEIGKPMLGIASGKNFPARIAGWSSSND